MKKVTAFVICLLLMVNVLGIEAFAADTVTGLDVSLVENKSFVEIGGKEIRVDKLEKNGCKLVLTPVMWMGQYHDQAGRPLTESYEELKKIPTYDAADDHFVPMAGRNGIALDKLTVLDFFHATVVRMDDGADVTESAKLTLTFSVPYASGIQMVLNQLPNDPAWNAVSFTADPGQITVTAGGRGRYAFLIPEGSAEQLLRGNSGRMDEYVPSAEQKGDSSASGNGDGLGDGGEKFIITHHIWNVETVANAGERVKTAYTQMARTPVEKLPYNDQGEKLKAKAREAGLDLDKLAVSDFFDVTFENSREEAESGQVIFEIPIAYASEVRLALNLLPDGTWKVVELMVRPGNGADKVTAVTVSNGGTGVYAFLVEEAVRDDILAGKYRRVNLFN